MENSQDRIKELQQKLDGLLNQHKAFAIEIQALKNELFTLKYSEQQKQTTPEERIEQQAKPVEEQQKPLLHHKVSSQEKPADANPQFPIKSRAQASKAKPKQKTDLERFIGENLISKIGIVITVIGVFIGVKYSIENELISPLTRIILGYLCSIGLLGFGLKLKKNYETYSAVLVSGAMTMMYFITFSAYNFYTLIPVELTFGLMVLFTLFTAFAAISYKTQIIAHLGLVGAYAIPFLLSDGSGRVHILFSYIALINIGILVVAFKKYWKSLYYSSFVLTWIMYISWYAIDYNAEDHLELAFAFIFVFFITFYLIFLSYKLIKKIKFDVFDIFFLLLNTFIFYGLGFDILSSNATAEEFLGLYTLANAILHFVVCLIIFKQKLADKNLFYFISALVLVFITITIPVQLDGNWVTLLWTTQAVLLFWIGRTKHVSVYENLSYSLMLLAFLSLLQDWDAAYELNLYADHKESITPLLNIHFLTSLIFVGAFGYITKLYFKTEDQAKAKPFFNRLIRFCIPALFIVSLYYGLRLEIANFWNVRFVESFIPYESAYGPTSYKNYDLLDFKTVWVLIYTLIFVALGVLLNLKKLKHIKVSYVFLFLSCFATLVFLVQGLYVLSELRESYPTQSSEDNFNKGIWHILLRYVAFIFVAISLYLANLNYTFWPKVKRFKRLFYSFLHLSILWILSSELINWLDLADVKNTYKLGLSILWGLYSLYLIVLGIWKKSKFLRVTAIVVFSITLIKLFVYDISHLNTISKTIVFVSLGLLLLIISFLYHKYNVKISDGENT